MRIVLVLDNIRSCYNVGAILRTAEGFGIKKVVLSGYTPRVHDEKLLPHLREKLDGEIHKTALGAEDMLEIDGSDDIRADLEEYRADGWRIVGLENNIKDERLKKINECKFSEDKKIVLVLGEEVEGINRSLFDLFDLFLEIPMVGQKESFNVSVAAGIAMFALRYYNL
ncbi:TrmH family RNA methyltransferase [Candidatus Saccharibacteria bacterium]|nr:TrmH family RNA methyltransferase [Candidatus Saccharibacteria bacterium]